MKKSLLALLVLLSGFILSGKALPENAVFEGNAWKEALLIPAQSASLLKVAPSGVENSSAKPIRLASKKFLPVKEGDIVQVRGYFKGKDLYCGVSCHNAQKGLLFTPRGVVKAPANGEAGSGSYYYKVPQGVAFIRIFADLNKGVSLKKLVWGIIDQKQQKEYFYDLTPKSLQVSFHSGEGKELPRHVANMWKSGTLEVVNDKFTTFHKAIRITPGGKRDAGFRFDVPFKVKKGDCVLVQTVFKGSGYARIGVYGSGLFKAKVIPTLNRMWDRREEIFEITSDKCKNLYVFLSAQKGHSLTYSYFKITKLENDPRISFQPERLAAKWRELTKGVDLARGKKVTAFPAHKKSTRFLTDGKISNMTNLVFASGALEWHSAMTGKHIRLITDLGSVKKVGKAGIRISGGKNIMRFPRMLKIYVSKDGKSYYPAASLAKVTPAEASLADWQNLYYLNDREQNGVTFTYPFVLNVNADARYVAFSVESDSYYSLITDELAVIEAAGKKSENWNEAYKKTPDSYFHHQSVKITPYVDKFYVAEDIFLPNLFYFDMRLPNGKEKFTYTLDLPSQLEFAPYKGWPPKAINHIKTEKKGNRNIYHFAPDYTVERLQKYSILYYNGPFLFRVPAGKTIPAKEQYCIISSQTSKGGISLRYPVEVLRFSKIPTYKRLKVGQMMNARYIPYWPDYGRSWKVVGYNMFQFESSPNQISPGKGPALCRETDKNGLYRRAFSNPICDMCYGTRRDKAELRCTSAVLPGKKWIGQLDFCPSYRGVYYKELLENIRKMVIAFKPHVIEFDDEAWNPKQLNFIFDCTRCQALRKKKNMDWKTFIEWAQADFLKGFYFAVKKGAEEAKIPMPDVTHWPFSPVSGNYFARGIQIMNHGFPYLFPKYANLATHFYYAQSVADQQKGIRKALETVKDPKRLAMTVHGGIGCYRTGYMGKKTTHLFLDSVLNGTTHVLQYGFFTTPHDYFQMNQALSLIVPYEDIIMDGKRDLSFTGSNKGLLYTRSTLGKRSLLLIGNYSGIRKAVTTLKIRGKVTNCATKKSVKANGSFKLELPPDDFALLLLEE